MHHPLEIAAQEVEEANASVNGNTSLAPQTLSVFGHSNELIEGIGRPCAHNPLTTSANKCPARSKEACIAVARNHWPEGEEKRMGRCHLLLLRDEPPRLFSVTGINPPCPHIDTKLKTLDAISTAATYYSAGWGRCMHGGNT